MTTKDQDEPNVAAVLKLVDTYLIESKTADLTGGELKRLYATMRNAIRTLAQPPAPDCRTCEQYRETEGICEYPLNHGLKQCTNGDKYQEAPQVVLWRTE